MIKKSLREHYRDMRAVPTPPQEFIKALAQLTHRTEKTVRFWLSGTQEPDLLTKEVIAQWLETPVEVLFPPKPTQEDDNS